MPGTFCLRPAHGGPAGGRFWVEIHETEAVHLLHELRLELQSLVAGIGEFQGVLVGVDVAQQVLFVFGEGQRFVIRRDVRPDRVDDLERYPGVRGQLVDAFQAELAHQRQADTRGGPGLVARSTSKDGLATLGIGEVEVELARRLVATYLTRNQTGVEAEQLPVIGDDRLAVVPQAVAEHAHLAAILTGRRLTNSENCSSRCGPRLAWVKSHTHTAMKVWSGPTVSGTTCSDTRS